MKPLLKACLPLLICLTAQAEVSETLGFKNYTVAVAPGGTLLRALDAATPLRQLGRPYHGIAAWEISWQFTWGVQSDGRCRIESIRTTLTSEITLPHLITSQPALQAQFDDYLNALRLHEIGHVDIARSAAQRIDQSILRLAPAPTCEALEQAANAVGYRLIDEARNTEVEYDRRTQFGRTQGAWLPR